MQRPNNFGNPRVNTHWGGVEMKCKFSFVLWFFLFSLFASCNLDDDSDLKTVVDCPAEIAARAFRFAELYEDSDTVYEWGGQSPLRSAIAIDCSGLVIMCYKYAMVDTKYSLLLSDMSANYMYENAASIVPLEKMRKGDLIFMGEADSSKVTHIALFDCKKDDNIYFIDSTEKEENNINGVTRRFYESDDDRFKAFGVIKLQY